MIYFSFGALPIGRGPKSEIPSSKIKLILPLYINKLVIGFSSIFIPKISNNRFISLGSEKENSRFPSKYSFLVSI